MEKIKNNQSGITLLVLTITIIVVIIISSIAVIEGRDLIEQSRVQDLTTNMMMIKGKAKAYAEEIDAKVWSEKDKDKENVRDVNFLDYGLEAVTLEEFPKTLDQISSDIKNGGYNAYVVTDSGLDKMGLDSLKDDDEYIVVYNIKDYKIMDVIYTGGISYNKNVYYSLSGLEDAIKE